MKLLIRKTVNKLIKKKLTISIAESCTGGLLSNSIVSVNGASKVFRLGLIVYSNESKIKILKVPKKIIKKYGSVSEQTCLSMLKNLSKLSKTSMSISITGIAGPRGGSIKKPIGLIYLGIKKNSNILIKKYQFKNNGRLNIQKNAVNKSLKLILKIAK